ncbi:MAG: hypothetical protein A2408_02495 [Candidatus Yonathbacteria bacterium RIFOXYC1_FULL_52_10]|uniref:RNA polymerase sigma factor 70 region 4 type 2 domain-containing protein n=1 Tax=Candidatus Yonathbacteria bacterium RIFOXYD1_FULL_52_36 TaxID=1802730 RepID=A0A1G2SK25_9BACT|nr:MAG: hypothetical protein A2408_02495 [Candidatus Yonathbacteria bacterium RIFOXYC1_FULL_52_10]OHA85433.1 MAG: hypothetical protein A2591_03070 [Candidatus Yonathbacteria bacterium RIFOXYD1_FULL_52_36]
MSKRTTTNHIERDFLAAYDAHADALFRHCLFRLSDRERAKELTQETFTRTWEYMITHPDEAVENIRALLYRIARNMIIDEYRSHKRYNQSLDALSEDEGFDLPDGDAHGAIVRGAEMSRLFTLMDDLPNAAREVLALRYSDDMAVKEIAELLGETENVISVRIHRGLAQLKKRMGPHT